MIATALPMQTDLINARGADEAAIGRAVFATTALMIGTAFFLAGHDLRISQAEAYTQNAEQMEIAAAGGNFLRRLGFIALGGWGVVLLAIGQARLRLAPALAGAVGLLLAIAAASFLWADDAGMCLRRLMTVVLCTVAAIGVARTLTVKEMCWLAVAVIGVLVVIGLAAEVALGTFRPWAGDYRFSGTVHPNTQGPSLAMLCLASLGLAREATPRRMVLWGVFAAALVLLFLTKSRTTAAATLLSLAAVQLMRSRVSFKIAGVLAVAWMGATALWLMWVAGIDPLSDFRDALLLGRAEESDTLSGRAFIWPEVLSYIRERPWLGYGYESFWTAGRIEAISEKLGWGLREAHNAYLEILLSMGIVGLAALLTVAMGGFAASAAAWRRTGNAAYGLPAGMIVFAALNAALESGVVAVTLVPFLLACLLMRLALFREAEEPKHECA